eukprot:364796-Chlamydomonas_euryale.AAC.15
MRQPPPPPQLSRHAAPARMPRPPLGEPAIEAGADAACATPLPPADAALAAARGAVAASAQAASLAAALHTSAAASAAALYTASASIRSQSGGRLTGMSLSKWEYSRRMQRGHSASPAGPPAHTYSGAPSASRRNALRASPPPPPLPSSSPPAGSNSCTADRNGTKYAVDGPRPPAVVGTSTPYTLCSS